MKKRNKKKKGPYPGMMAVLAFDGKTGEVDTFMRFDTGPLPPIVRPEHPSISQDTGPEDPEQDKKRKERPA
jgi:hypothetical protein